MAQIESGGASAKKKNLPRGAQRPRRRKDKIDEVLAKLSETGKSCHSGFRTTDFAAFARASAFIKFLGF
jgi:hypothetical protein